MNQTITDEMDDAKGQTEDKWDEITQLLGDTDLSDIASNVIDTFQDGLSNAWDNITDWASGAVSSLKDTVSNAVSWVKIE